MKEKLYIPPPAKRIDLLEDSSQRFKQILVMENDPKSEAALRHFFGSRHFDAFFVKSAMQGFHEIAERDFDIILCNMIEPIFAGEMFYKAVERFKPNLCRCFIYMTDHRPNPAAEAFIRSVNGLKLWKPFEPHVLQETIQLALAKAGGKAAAARTKPVVAVENVALPAPGENPLPIKEIQDLTRLMITSARKSVRFSTIDFSPNEVLIEALILAAKRGVEVEIMVPDRLGEQVRNMIPAPIQQRFLDAGIALLAHQATMPSGCLIIIDDLWAGAAPVRSPQGNMNIYHGPCVTEIIQAFQRFKTETRRIKRAEEDNRVANTQALAKATRFLSGAMQSLPGFMSARSLFARQASPG